MTQIESILPEDAVLNRFGFFTSLSFAALTFITFVIAAFTPPISGPFCQGDCINYPYLDIISRFPRDYIWMYTAMLMMLVFIAFIASIHQSAPKEKKIFSLLSLTFAGMAAVIVVTDYFLQVSVIQASLVHGETEGIPLLTQYNEHGIFIALEDIGYLLMSLSLLFIAPALRKKRKLENAVRWIVTIGFLLVLISLILISIFYGINRSYRFEVAVITITWTVAILSAILMALDFRGRIKREDDK